MNTNNPNIFFDTRGDRQNGMHPMHPMHPMRSKCGCDGHLTRKRGCPHCGNLEHQCTAGKNFLSTQLTNTAPVTEVPRNNFFAYGDSHFAKGFDHHPIKDDHQVHLCTIGRKFLSTQPINTAPVTEVPSDDTFAYGDGHFADGFDPHPIQDDMQVHKCTIGRKFLSTQPINTAPVTEVPSDDTVAYGDGRFVPHIARDYGVNETPKHQCTIDKDILSTQITNTAPVWSYY